MERYKVYISKDNGMQIRYSSLLPEFKATYVGDFQAPIPVKGLEAAITCTLQNTFCPEYSNDSDFPQDMYVNDLEDGIHIYIPRFHSSKNTGALYETLCYEFVTALGSKLGSIPRKINIMLEILIDEIFKSELYSDEVHQNLPSKHPRVN